MVQYGDKAYYFSHHENDLRTYDDSAYVCQYGHGDGRLVSVNSHSENRFLALSMRGDGPSWIGLSCPRGPCSVSERRWPDGSLVEFSSDIEEVMRDDTAVALFNNAAWRARGLDNRLSYICERDDPCVATPCLNGGRCTFNIVGGTRTCTCPHGTLGSDCSCDGSLCEHDTQCLNDVDETPCDCGGRYSRFRCSDHRSRTLFR